MNEENLAKAKIKAQNYLELAILSLSIALGEDPEDISSSMDIPVAMDDPNYQAYVSLRKMLVALERIQ